MGAVQSVRAEDQGTAGILEEGQCAFWSAAGFQSIREIELRRYCQLDEALSRVDR